MISTGICRWLFLLISLSTWTRLIDSKEMRIVCYYTNWSVYRPGQAKFSPQNINPYLCTHLVYAFGGFTKENTLKPFDKYQDIEKGGYAKFTGLKTYNKNLKTLIAIGGWNEGSSRFSPMVASADRRKELVRNTIKFLRQNHFDGLDLDWEYPTFRDGGEGRDRDNYAQLVQELREEFERESEKTGRPRLLLTMAVPAGIEYINKGYDVPKLTKYLDWMNILSYDYHSAFEPAVNHHAPLYSLEEDNEYNYDTELNIDYTIKHYLKLGADPNKLVLGIPTYGRSYTLFNPEAYEIGSPADGPGDMGEATRENGYLAYYEICEYVKDQDWEVDEPNSNAMGPIAFKDNQWVGYDDENIVRKKAEYVAENSLGGIMFWAIDNDDFRGNCHGRPYPLIEAGKEALLNAYGLTEENLISPPSKPTKSSKPKSRPRTTKTTTTEQPPKESTVSSLTAARRRRIKSKARDDEIKSASSPKRRKDSLRKSEGTSTYSSLKVITPAYTTPAPPATPDMGGAFKCEDEGFFSHPKDCKKYFWCLGGPGDTGIVAHQFTCPAGLYFNKGADSCDYSQNVLCNKKLQKATSTTTPKVEQSSTESTTSPKPTPNTIFSTSRVPPKITAATAKTTFFRTTTTTEAYEDEDEYEDDDVEPGKKEESEEDPKVIKELIDLIKKAGGIEELEKQLHFGKDGSPSATTADVTTPSGLSKSLYERVLSKASKSSLSALRNKSVNRNSGGPQGNAEQEPKEKKIDRGRPQYRTLNRQRPSTETSTVAEFEEENKEETKERKSFRPKSTLEYVNIRRPKASSTTEAYEDDGFNRNKVLGEPDDDLDDEDEEDDSEDAEDVAKKSNNIPQYVNIRRQGPSTTETAASKYASIRRSTASPIEAEAEADQEEKIYKQVRRGTTTDSSINIGSNEPTTSLRYQTIRRGTTTTPTATLTDNDDDDDKRTTSTSLSPTTDANKYSATTRTTTASPGVEPSESTTKNDTVRREPSTQSTVSPTSEGPSSTEISEQGGAYQEVNVTALPGTTLPQESIRNISTITTENLISSTHKETTEINSNTPNSTSSTTTRSDSVTAPTEPETKKKRPVLFQPRPFSVGTSSIAKSTIPPEPATTVTSKVSQSNLKYRLRANNSSSSTTTTEPPPNSNTLRSRSRTRYSNVNRNLNEDTEQEEKYERTAENKPTRSRKRLVGPTEAPLDSNEDSDRKYRPAELPDWSSLTAADLNIRGGQFISSNRRRRPAATTTSSLSATEKPLDEDDKTRFKGKSRRIVNTTDDQVNASSDQTSTTRKIVRGFRSTTPRAVIEESSGTTGTVRETTKAPARTRKIIRRFRPGASTTSTTEQSVRSETLSTSTEASAPTLQRRRIPSFRTRHHKNNVTPSTTTPSNVTTESIQISASSSSESPLLKLFKTRSRFDVAKNDTVSTEEEDEDELSNEHTDVLNGEEGENIKLSESNIRESSQINSFGVDEKPTRKQKFGSNKAAIEKQQEASSGAFNTTTAATVAEMARTEPTRILRRKIVRKLGTVPSTEPPSTTTVTANIINKRRLVSRRRRPSNANELEAKREEKVEQSSTKKDNVFRGQTSTEPISSAPQEDVSEKGESKRTTERIQVEEEENKFVPNKFRVFRPTTDSYSSVKSPAYNLYSRPTYDSSYLNGFGNDHDDDDDEQDDNTENRDQDDDDDVDDIDDADEGRNPTQDGEPKYTVYTTSSLQRTHKFESNTNFNDEDEEGFDSNLKANKSISSLILKTALNSVNESKTVLDEASGEELKDEGEHSNKQNNRTTIIKVNNLPRSQPTVRQRLTLGKEEVKTQSQQDLLQTQPVYSPKSTTVEPEQDITSPTTNAVTELNNVGIAKDNNVSVPISDTTETIDSTTLVVNELSQENDGTIATNDILLTTTEELKETTLKHVTDEPLEISHPDEIDETSSISSITDATENIEESTQPILSNLTESTTEYHRRSTLRSIKERPRLGFTRRTTESTTAPSTTEAHVDGSTKKTFTRNFGRGRLKASSTSKPVSFGRVRSTTPLPLNKLLYKPSTTERGRINVKDNEYDDEEEDDEISTESIVSRPSTTHKIVNQPVKNAPNKPKFFKTSSTTEATVLENLGVDTEAVKNRNKNLFSKRKMNTPFVTSLSSSTTPVAVASSSDYSETTTTSSGIQSDSTDPSLTTLHHIFAEIDDVDTTTESMSSSPTTNSGKVERLIEVNRIVEVKTKRGKGKHQPGEVEVDAKVEITPTVDKIGEISRITLIKIVDGNNETIVKDQESNEIVASSTSPVYVPSLIEIAKVEEIPASKAVINQNINLKNIQFDVKMNSEREDRKFEIFGDSKVANSKELTNPLGKPEIFDGISHINVVTPKPLLVTEASTISLQGLFQTEKPHLNPSFTLNDEVLETDRSEFVSVRLLNQELDNNNGLRGPSNFIPVRVLSQDEDESTIKAHVMEISPKPDSRTIKIVPIRVEMSRSLANQRLPPKLSGVKT